MSEGYTFKWNEKDSISNFVDDFYEPDSMILGRLGRGAENQQDVANLAQSNEELCGRLNVLMTRYAIWAQTAATTLNKFCEDRGQRSAELSSIKEVEASLRAFVAIQEKFVNREITDGREL